MDKYFKGLVERAFYYEQFETFRKNLTVSCEELVPKIGENEREKKVSQVG
jgi:hypothetical protein